MIDLVIYTDKMLNKLLSAYNIVDTIWFVNKMELIDDIPLTGCNSRLFEYTNYEELAELLNVILSVKRPNESKIVLFTYSAHPDDYPKEKHLLTKIVNMLVPYNAAIVCRAYLDSSSNVITASGIDKSIHLNANVIKFID